MQGYIKRLTEGTHKISDDLTVANAVDSWHALFSRATIHSSMECQTGSLFAECG